MNPTLLEVLAELHRNPRSIASDYARAVAQELAALASQGLLTTRLPQRKAAYGRVWRLTAQGAILLEKAGML